MKILVVAKAYPPETGGIETYSEEIAKAYAAAGHDVTVLTAHPGALGAQDRDGVAIHNIGQGAQAGVFYRMARWLRAHRTASFDFVHATTWRVGLPSLLMRLKAPLVVTIHGREVFVVPKVLKPAMRYVLTKADHLPTVSAPILDRAREVNNLPLAQGFANWNGISFPQENATISDKPAPIQIFCMCRMVARKNVDNAIKAVAALIRDGLDIRFDIAGSGEELSRLKTVLEAENIGNRIVLHGRIPDDQVPGFYSKAHIFLHPQVATRGGNDMEGFGLTIADGMAFGCIPIAGASGGPLDFITPDKTGYLVDGHDQEAIKAAIRDIYDHPEKRGEMSQAGREFALTHLTWDSHVQTILKNLSA